MLAWHDNVLRHLALLLSFSSRKFSALSFSSRNFRRLVKRSDISIRVASSNTWSEQLIDTLRRGNVTRTETEGVDGLRAPSANGPHHSFQEETRTEI